MESVNLYINEKFDVIVENLTINALNTPIYY